MMDKNKIIRIIFIDKLSDRYAALVIVQSRQGEIRKIYSKRYPSYRADK